uniref:Nebulette n=1 Tax=Tetraodon nigroviridis TaxID=99883 RepID=H3CBY1_TETNG
IRHPSFLSLVPEQVQAKYKKSGKEEGGSCYSVMAETLDTQHAKQVSQLQSQVRYREEGQKELPSCLFSSLPQTLQTEHAKEATALQSQNKYKDAGRKEMTSSLYCRLPETSETLFAREMTEMQSEKFYKEKYNREKGKSSFSHMKTLPEVEHATEVHKHQSDVNYRKGKEELHHYKTTADRPDIISATNAAKLASEVVYKNTNKLPVYSDSSLLARTDISHAKEASKLASQVKYKQGSDRLLKGQRPRYNPLECLSFKHSPAAAALASQVKYKSNQNQKQEGSLDLPNLLQLEHALNASRLQSNVHYKKQYEETKARYHLVVDTAEQRHHKDNARLLSQVKYKEEFERNKGASQMEFGDTEAYRVSKEAQKMQSEKEYRKDFEEQIKGKALVDVDQTPGYLTARHASSLLSEEKTWNEGEKGRGLSGVGLEETPELLRVKNANQILNEKHYRRILEREIVGKGMELSAEVLEIQRAKSASEIQSAKHYRRDLEREIVGKGMELSAEVLEIQRAKRASEIQSERSYKQTEQLRENSYGTVTDTPELLHASYLKDIYSQKKYKDEAQQLKGSFCLGAQTPEMERVKSNQQHISSVRLHLSRAEPVTPALCRPPAALQLGLQTDAESDVLHHGDAGDAPGQGELQEDQPCLPVQPGVLPEFQRDFYSDVLLLSLQVQYRQKVGGGTAVTDTPEMQRVRRNQENISSVRYQRGLQEVKGRSCTELDTPEYRRVRRSQEAVSTAKYHEDFERTRGRGCSGLDNPCMDRYQRANQMVAEAAYSKGVHPQAMELDRRPGGIIVDLKVWRTDPGSIFDLDPLEDNIQSISLRRMSERARPTLSRQHSQQSQSISSLTSDLWDRGSADTPGSPTFSLSSAPVLPGAYHQGVQHHQQQQHHGYMHQTSMSSVRSVTSPPHSATMRVYRALYDYAAQDHDEVSFRDGDVIVNAQPIDEGWMYGTVQRTGKSGMLPANYVECCN